MSPKSNTTLALYYIDTGKQILDKRLHEIKDAISTGIVDESKPVGKSFLANTTLIELYIYTCRFVRSMVDRRKIH